MKTLGSWPITSPDTALYCKVLFSRKKSQLRTFGHFGAKVIVFVETLHSKFKTYIYRLRDSWTTSDTKYFKQHGPWILQFFVCGKCVRPLNMMRSIAYEPTVMAIFGVNNYWNYLNLKPKFSTCQSFIKHSITIEIHFMTLC